MADALEFAQVLQLQDMSKELSKAELQVSAQREADLLPPFVCVLELLTGGPPDRTHCFDASAARVQTGRGVVVGRCKPSSGGWVPLRWRS